MKVVGWILWTLCVITLAGCGHDTGNSQTAASSAGKSTVASAPSAVVHDPAAPDRKADFNTWGDYLSQLGKLHAKDAPGHPYIYVVPDGDSQEAQKRRQEELDSIQHSVGPILIPGSLLIIGGPDGPTTDAFVSSLGKKLEKQSLAGIVVLVVGDSGQSETTKKVLSGTGADVRFVAM